MALILSAAPRLRQFCFHLSRPASSIKSIRESISKFWSKISWLGKTPTHLVNSKASLKSDGLVRRFTNHESCLDLLNDLEKRGLAERGLLFIVDGGSGLNKALNIKYLCDDKRRRRAVRIRCHVHKWRNIEKALGDEAHKATALFWGLRDAKDMAEAKVLSDRLESVLRDLNMSALESYREAKEDLLVIHELRLSRQLKQLFSTTNPIESLNSLIEEDMRRVKKWQDSEHFQRWLATYCLHSEKKMHRVRGYMALPGLWVLLRELTEDKQIDSKEEAV